MATYNSKLKWAYPPNFEKLYNSKDVQMMLKHFFDISTGFRYKKNGKEFSVHL